MAVLTPRQAMTRAAAPQRTAGLDGRQFDLDSLALSTRGLSVADIEADVVDATMARTIGGASTVTLTLMDPGWRWATSRFFSSRSLVTVDGEPFSLASVRRSGGDQPRLEATFEAWLVARLRVPNAPKKARRDARMSRARFAGTLVQEIPGARFAAPEMGLRQPVSKPDQAGRVLPYEFRRGEAGRRESSWEALGRLADEVGWRRFEVSGVVWFVSDDWLIAQSPLVAAPPDAAWLDAGRLHVAAVPCGAVGGAPRGGGTRPGDGCRVGCVAGGVDTPEPVVAAHRCGVDAPPAAPPGAGTRGTAGRRHAGRDVVRDGGWVEHG